MDFVEKYQRASVFFSSNRSDYPTRSQPTLNAPSERGASGKAIVESTETHLDLIHVTMDREILLRSCNCTASDLFLDIYFCTMGQTEIALAEVARNWLRRENNKPYRDFDFEREKQEWKLVGELLCQCPFQAAFIWQHHLEWYATELSETEFLHLRVIDGPADSSWRKLSPDNTIRGAAKRIIESELPDTFEDIDVAYIKRLADGFEKTTPEERLTLIQPEPDEAPIVVDGNHYLTAKMIHRLRSGAYAPQPAYIGVRQDCTIHDG